MITENETVTLGWCDNGITDGKFTEGVTTAILNGPNNGIFINSVMRVQGNQIARQRQVLFNTWADKGKTDWLLWVDSDIFLNLNALKKVWDTVDKKKKPVVCGTYFISKENENSVMEPFPVLFNDISHNKIEYIHPLPYDQVIKIDCAGFGFTMMHKSIIHKLRKAFPKQSFFAEDHGDGDSDNFIGEDIVFYRKLKKAGIPLYAHTGALVQHIKRFSLDSSYYGLYWTMEEAKNRGFIDKMVEEYNKENNK